MILNFSGHKVINTLLAQLIFIPHVLCWRLFLWTVENRPWLRSRRRVKVEFKWEQLQATACNFPSNSIPEFIYSTKALFFFAGQLNVRLTNSNVRNTNTICAGTNLSLYYLSRKSWLSMHAVFQQLPLTHTITLTAGSSQYSHSAVLVSAEQLHRSSVGLRACRR